MNNQQRKQINKIIERFEELLVEVTEINEIEQAKLDNTPDNLTDTPNFEKQQDLVYDLENAVASIEESIESLQSSITK